MSKELEKTQSAHETIFAFAQQFGGQRDIYLDILLDVLLEELYSANLHLPSTQRQEGDKNPGHSDKQDNNPAC